MLGWWAGLYVVARVMWDLLRPVVINRWLPLPLVPWIGVDVLTAKGQILLGIQLNSLVNLTLAGSVFMLPVAFGLTAARSRRELFWVALLALAQWVWVGVRCWQYREIGWYSVPDLYDAPVEAVGALIGASLFLLAGVALGVGRRDCVKRHGVATSATA
jgi:hypothetical protein